MKIDLGHQPTICYLRGDGVGIDIMPPALRVWEAAVNKAYGSARKINWLKCYAGDEAREKYGQPLPDETLRAIQEYKVAIKGPLTTPVGAGARSLNVALRQTLDLYICLRPVRYFPGTPSPVKNPEKTNTVIFRENTEDIYAGIEWASGTDDVQKVIRFLQNDMGVSKIRFPQSSAIGIKPVSREGSERLIRAALQYAVENQRHALTIVHKGNIMKFTEGGFKNWGYDLVRNEFSDVAYVAADVKNQPVPTGKIAVKDCICDAFLQDILLHPEAHDVVAAPNLNGDYISDALAAIVGGIGIAPGANINAQTGHAVFEATHGTAPLIAGQNIANPCSLILSGEMLLRYIGFDAAADCVLHAVEKAIAAQRVTADFTADMPHVTPLSTSDFADALIELM